MNFQFLKKKYKRLIKKLSIDQQYYLLLLFQLNPLQAMKALKVKESEQQVDGG